jgi:phosphatidylinositol-3-phosphatase
MGQRDRHGGTKVSGVFTKGWVILAAMALFLGTGAEAKALPAAPCGTLSSPPPATYKHVIWIWFENRSYGDVIGNPNAPYFNLLATNCGSAVNFYSETHRSWRNYMVATSGAWYTEGLTKKYSLFEQVLQAGLTWRVYAQTMPSNCYIENYYSYDRDHNAAAHYTKMRNACNLYDIPMGGPSRGALATDARANALASYVQVIPNNCNNMHHDCNGGDREAATAAGDLWLQTWIPLLAATSDYQLGQTVIFITFDEGRPYTNSGENCLEVRSEDCHIPALVSSRYGKGQQVTDFFSHFGLLRTTEELLGLPCLRLACSSEPFYGAGSMRAAFGI